MGFRPGRPNINPAQHKALPLAAIIMIIRQYDIFELSKDLNPVITQGMQGVILEILDRNTFLVEFVNEDGTNKEFEGAAIFTIDSTYLKGQ